ncbi:MAG: VWA domain-containing protein [Acidobacteria bacterium]|nr:VWA domain-containing protein [Acidobacteriota bacterium]
MRRLLACLITASMLSAQQEIVFRAESNLIVVNVTVRDSSGRPIEGLKKEDFQLFEDDKPQQISVFELQKLGTDPLPAISVPAATPAAPKTEPTEPAAEKPQTKDKRLMVLFFDFSGMPVAEQVRSQDAAVKFLESQMTSSDLVSLMTFSNDLRLVQDFTADRAALVTAIRAFRTGEGTDLAATGDAPTEEEEDDGNILFSADDSEFNLFNTDRKLGALEAAARQLAAYPEKKALVYFSSGVSKTGTENHSQLRATINAAVKANVAIYALDARGLVPSAPAGDASKAAPSGKDLFSGLSMKKERDKFHDQQETLYSLAADTGGKALLDSNDLTTGIRQAQRDINTYYLLGYYSTNPAPDGRFRKIRVRLSPSLKAKLDYRPGYYAPKLWNKFTSEDKERQLEEALQLGNPATELPIALEVNYFRMEKGQFFVPIAVKIPGSEIVLAKKGGTEQAELDFLGQVRDAKNRVQGSVRDTIRVKLSAENAALLAERQLQYDTGFSLAPGQYRLKFLARENSTGKMGAFETQFTVPDFGATNDSVHMSTVVWSNQREPLTAEIGAAEKSKKALARHPLITGNHKLAPSITRVYRRNQRLYVYFEVYDPAKATEGPSVAASLALYRGKQKAFESSPVRLSQFTPHRGETLAFQFQAALAQLKPGSYTAQINVIDEQGRRFTYSRAPLVLRD